MTLCERGEFPGSLEQVMRHTSKSLYQKTTHWIITFGKSSALWYCRHLSTTSTNFSIYTLDAQIGEKINDGEVRNEVEVEGPLDIGACVCTTSIGEMA